jgi:Short C-terminal domain
MIRRRRPIMRGAMVGGIGYMAGKAGAKRAAQESPQGMEGGQPPAAAPAAATAPPPAAGSKIEQLKQLGELRDSGVLTPDEFEREKQKILAGGGA